jgi:hypothetical protein
MWMSDSSKNRISQADVAQDAGQLPDLPPVPEEPSGGHPVGEHEGPGQDPRASLLAAYVDRLIDRLVAQVRRKYERQRREGGESPQPVATATSLADSVVAAGGLPNPCVLDGPVYLMRRHEIGLPSLMKQPHESTAIIDPLNGIERLVHEVVSQRKRAEKRERKKRK